MRRAFLCGEDYLTGRNYEHRKGWVLERLPELQAVFSVDVCAYAIMSNHYHLVIRLNREAAAELPDAEVIDRWGKLFAVPLLVARYDKSLCESDAEESPELIMGGCPPNLGGLRRINELE